MCSLQNLYFNLAVIIITLHTCSPISTTQENPPPETCGTLHTSTGYTITFLKGVPLTTNEFNKIRNITLNKSLFIPENGCAIQVCGFMSWGTPVEEGYIGSTSDYTDCMEISDEGPGDAVFYEPFYMSSIACGCKTPTISKCMSTCTDIRTKTWNTSSCAYLYEERDCNECYFPHTPLQVNETYTTNNTLHVMSLAVRPGCRVLQYSPGMNRVYWYKDTEQPVVYNYNVEQHDVTFSSFLGDNEKFVCECGVVVEELNPDLKQPGDGGGGMSWKTWRWILVGGVGVVLGVVVVGGYLVRGKVIGGRVRERLTMFFDHGIVREHTDQCISVIPESRFGSTASTCLTTSSVNDSNLEEKLDDVKKLLEILCGCSTNPSQVRKPLQHEQVIGIVGEQFKIVCKPENVISRDAILFTEASRLGSGQFGTVYRGVVTSSDGLRETVAVKLMGWGTDDHVSCFLREVKSYQDVTGGPHIVRFVGGCVCRDGLLILTEFCDGGSLQEYLVSLRVYESVKELGDGYTAPQLTKMSDEKVSHELVRFSYQIACGMEWLSGKGVVHGDLAVRNVLLSGDDKVVRICDFGLSRKCCGGEYVVGDLTKFPYNSLAPEICKCTDHTYKLSSNVDVWAFGCTLYEIFTLGGSMYAHVQAEGADKVIEVIRLIGYEGFRHQRPGIMGDDVYDKVMECWDDDPCTRPSFTNLKEFFEHKCFVT